MLYIIIVKGSQRSEADLYPSQELMEAMDRYNEDLEAAGVRVMAKGLHPSSTGIRIAFETPGEKPVVTRGPFHPAEEIMAGCIIIDVASEEDAIDWAMRMPDPMGHGEGRLELRKIHG